MQAVGPQPHPRKTPPPYPRTPEPCLSSPRCTRPRGLSRGIVRPGAVAGFGRRRRCGRRLPKAEWPQVPLVKGLMAATPKIPARGAGRREIGAASTSTSTLDIGTRQGRAPPGSAHPLWGAMMRNPAAPAGRPGSIIGRCTAPGWIPACAASRLVQDDGVEETAAPTKKPGRLAPDALFCWQTAGQTSAV
eukprot:gene47108-63088_t